MKRVIYLVLIYVALIAIYTFIPSNLSVVRAGLSWFLLGMLLWIGIASLANLRSNRDENPEANQAE